MAPAARKDPFERHSFVVEIDGLTVASFAECTGLGASVDVIEYREGADASPAVRKLPGLVRYSNIVLRRGVVGSAELWEWFRTAVEGRVERRNGSIVLLDDRRSEVVRWSFREGWICRWEGPALHARTSDVAVETIEICHEGLDLQAP